MMRRAFSLLLVAAVGSLPLAAAQIKKGGWLFPNPARAEKKAIRPVDATGRIAGKETLMKIYKKKDQDVVFETLEIEGEVFACQFHIKGKDGKPTDVYAIVDTDGDGVFESKFGAGEAAKTPEWVIQRYFKKHPDLHDPGPSVDAAPAQ
ncbi:MAG TPA: hypothetical protein VGR67_13235 [Candidatus Polarisedimenticolia bacterium]|jgi:hypothetical protein|nr:hypothetical protein [Candidatus Polarisedimenticolia bacterium]